MVTGKTAARRRVSNMGAGIQRTLQDAEGVAEAPVVVEEHSLVLDRGVSLESLSLG